jgi:ketosteroid isomerase-like protein
VSGGGAASAAGMPCNIHQAENRMGQDRIAQNLDVVERHFALEATDIEAAIDLYTEDVTREWSSRGIALGGKAVVAENYRRMFATMADFASVIRERFATDDRVVDDSTVRFTWAGDGSVEASAPGGARVETRLLHLFHMRDGKIARELVFDA